MTHPAFVVLLTVTTLMSVPGTGGAWEARPILATTAMATPALPSTAITTEAVARITFPTAAIPSPPAIVDVWLWTLSPNQELAFADDELPPSIAADVLLSGEVTVQSSGQMQVQRDQVLEEISPGATITLRAGEAVIYVDNQAAQVVRNTGDTSARAISIGVFSAAPPSSLSAGPLGTEDWERSGLAGHDVVVTLERLTLAPGASLPSFTPDVHAPRIFAVAEGVVQSAVVPAAATTPSRPVSFRRDDVIWFRTLNSGEQRALRNEVDRPLVLMHVTLSGDAADEQASVSSGPAARATPTP